MIDTIKGALAPVHREGYRFIAIFACLSVLAFWFLPDVFGYLCLVLTGWCAYFFRDPQRVTPVSPDLVISPADGRISAIEDVAVPAELELGYARARRVSVFMNVFDVHVNRAPVAARVARLSYVPGKFLNAELDKASADNERQALSLEMEDGLRIGVVQIAGLVARRIVGFTGQGDVLQAGERFGLIRFGSRVDVYLPVSARVTAIVGQRALAGETVLANLNGEGGPLDGIRQ